MDGSPDVELLLRAYEIERDDERSAHAIFAAFLAILVTLLGGLAAVVVGDAVELPDWAFAAVPLAPLGIIALSVPLYASAVVRSRYIQHLERALMAGPTRLSSSIPVPSGHHITRMAWTGARGYLTYGTACSTASVLFSALTVMALRETQPQALQIAAAAAYGALGGIFLVLLAEGLLTPNRLWQRSLRYAAQHPPPPA